MQPPFARSQKRTPGREARGVHNGGGRKPAWEGGFCDSILRPRFHRPVSEFRRHGDGHTLRPVGIEVQVLVEAFGHLLHLSRDAFDDLIGLATGVLKLAGNIIGQCIEAATQFFDLTGAILVFDLLDTAGKAGGYPADLLGDTLKRTSGRFLILRNMLAQAGKRRLNTSDRIG